MRLAGASVLLGVVAVAGVDWRVAVAVVIGAVAVLVWARSGPPR